ncbi:hypothetical protein CQA49_06010 [Helicobacter sp. MIT 00-7814]|uniref:DUF5408 family protein n=1 Tax=unclassified Helicobacter TaxID=2593540 RepID=UPI000E1E2BDB|nr:MULTISPECIES: DUF5408 family protein [unclassified Helicobacter]RDU53438.1 hypothetical protein CQA37_06920 [Helicobacter sp. MIT 99-10781]RDU53736.1 hypothetical protein CQA49_06010 [Helicobacter sp. MIT 00-7814]
MAHEEDVRAIAKRAVKIALFCVGLVVLFSIVNIYVLLVQVDSTAGISHRVIEVEKKIENMEKLKDK